MKSDRNKQLIAERDALQAQLDALRDPSPEIVSRVLQIYNSGLVYSKNLATGGTIVRYQPILAMRNAIVAMATQENWSWPTSR